MVMESDFSKPVNIGSDRLITIEELANMIIKISGKTIIKKYDVTAIQGVRGRNADLSFLSGFFSSLGLAVPSTLRHAMKAS